MDIEVIPREDFLAEYWTYRAGEHVTFLGITGSGKTQLKWELLRYTANTRVPAVVIVSKPKDKTSKEWGMDRLGYRRILSYPLPIRKPFAKKPTGYLLWPTHSTDFDADDYRHGIIFKEAMRDLYVKGNFIVDVDEMLDLVDLKLEPEMRRLWTRGRSMGSGLWAGTQDPFHVPTQAYRQAAHLFLAPNPDARCAKRYEEIGGGIDPRQIREWVSGLGPYEFLYLRRRDRTACVVTK